MAERLQKILAHTGLGSRRELEGWISDGLINLNGQLAKLGDKAKADDNLTINGRFYRVVRDDHDSRQVMAYYKPLGEITTRSDPEKRRTVFERLPRLKEGRWIAVGRLDINTMGLLLLTNDGELANGLMHPSREVEREYAIRVNGRVTPESLERLAEGVELEDGPAKFEKVWPDGRPSEGANQWYRAIVKEGRNREVRRLWESQGVQVSRLIRVRYGPVMLPKWLSRGGHTMLEGKTLDELIFAAGMDPKKNQSRSLKAIPVHPRHKRRANRKR